MDDTQGQLNIWDHPGGVGSEPSISGYAVAAVDGIVGTVDTASFQASPDCLVIHVGRWLFGHNVMVPASLIDGIDVERRTVQLRCPRRSVEVAPNYDPEHPV
jgi:hypothetical protein